MFNKEAIKLLETVIDRVRVIGDVTCEDDRYYGAIDDVLSEVYLMIYELEETPNDIKKESGMYHN